MLHSTKFFLKDRHLSDNNLGIVVLNLKFSEMFDVFVHSTLLMSPVLLVYHLFDMIKIYVRLACILFRYGIEMACLLTKIIKLRNYI